MKKYSEIALTGSALFWGVSGVLTQVALKDMSPMMLISSRFLIAALLGVLVFRSHLKKINLQTVKDAFVLSLLLLIIYISSTVGLKYTSASNAGFIIGSSVILVPIINMVFFGKKLKRKELASSMLCLIGLGLVTLKGATGLNIGDFYCFIDALAYSLFIIFSSKLKNADIKALSSLQYLFVFMMTAVYVILFEKIDLSISLPSVTAIILLGSACTFLAFLFQIAAQRHLSAERTSRILALIPIFTLVFDYLYFGVLMPIPALVGGLLIVLATVVIDMDFKKNRIKSQTSS